MDRLHVFTMKKNDWANDVFVAPARTSLLNDIKHTHENH